MTDFEEYHDSKVIGFGLELDNDGTRTTSANITIALRKTMFTGKVYMKTSMAADKNDKDYRIVLVNTVFDVTKLLNGIAANPFIKTILDNYLKAIDFEPKFPMHPVNMNGKVSKT